ncbi:MAG: hypothetical protein GEU93_14820 [Propionibacteriales bacterium]|nr:hypothetical protein [Propionibacteriales bacterium]
MPEEAPSQSPPRDGLGNAALVVGLVALVFAFVPIVGEFVAAPSAVLAIVLGVIGLVRAERGHATNGGTALAGIILGVVAGFVVFLVMAATVGPGG